MSNVSLGTQARIAQWLAWAIMTGATAEQLAKKAKCGVVAARGELNRFREIAMKEARDSVLVASEELLEALNETMVADLRDVRLVNSRRSSRVSGGLSDKDARLLRSCHARVLQTCRAMGIRLDTPSEPLPEAPQAIETSERAKPSEQLPAGWQGKTENPAQSLHNESDSPVGQQDQESCEGQIEGGE